MAAAATPISPTSPAPSRDNRAIRRLSLGGIPLNTSALMTPQPRRARTNRTASAAETKIGTSSSPLSPQQFNSIYQILAAFNRNDGQGHNLFVAKDNTETMVEFRYYTGHRQNNLSISGHPAGATPTNSSLAADIESLQKETFDANENHPYVNFIFNKRTGDLVISCPKGLSNAHIQDAIVTGLQMKTRACLAQAPDQNVELKLDNLNGNTSNIAKALFYFLQTTESAQVSSFILPRTASSTNLINQLTQLSASNSQILARIQQLFQSHHTVTTAIPPDARAQSTRQSMINADTSTPQTRPASPSAPGSSSPGTSNEPGSPDTPATRGAKITSQTPHQAAKYTIAKPAAQQTATTFASMFQNMASAISTSLGGTAPRADSPTINKRI